MNQMMTDEEIDEMYEQRFHQRETSHVEQQPQPQPQRPGPIQLFPLSIAQQPGVPAANGDNNGFLGRRLGGVPVWAWGLITLGVGGTGYFFWRGRKDVTGNPEDSSSDASSSVPALPASTGGWGPSRTRVADGLKRFFDRKGHGDKVTVWHDADDAKKQGKMKHVSPLVNVQVKGKVKIDSALTKFCRREGLNPVQHNDGSIGMYPHESKRGKEWEEYVDALRDEGQSI